ncbi:alpha-L-fucosidase [Niabella beijingensis]|uniref:alpha-L-fucosidase n=1 Tax=Niabella beijingensis TaxID=2872700 RepID=UPI001CC0620E|nr:alpha-L-fucosidase [Niabella beijingensis]MBZ4189948.1 alpha-L-fucosidase [Niabella beijingensis]
MWKKIKKAAGLAAMLCLLITAHGQEQGMHQQSSLYEWPGDPLVKQKLEQWQDQKFGMIIHWGLYAVPGIVESWSICSEDWIGRDSTIPYDRYKQWYWGLKKDFNPVNFNPDQWADAAKAAGMRYLVFTTKHHDGFNMFDTKQSDFKISNGPFRNNPRSDVAKYVFEAFRKRGFMTGAYFSKPDWHNENYWWPMYATPDRNVNYDIRKFPWRWQKFKEFTYNQISELMHNYGALDILWLDGGWVRPISTVTDEVRAWGARIPESGQDIDMPRIAAMARQAQPGILMVDRTVHGPYENYQTPEQRVPDHRINNPWESCMTLGGAWGYVPGDQLKPASKVIHTLVEIVAKGGSLLLGVGPQADGTLTAETVSRLNEIGLWLKANGAAIYNTRSVEQYNSGDTYFTRSKDGKTNYAITLVSNAALPAIIEWEGNLPRKGSVIRSVATGEKIKWTVAGNKLTLQLPARLKAMKDVTALAFSFVND